MKSEGTAGIHGLVDNHGYGGARGDVVERLECGLADPTPSRVSRGSSRRLSPRRQTSEEIEEALDAKCAELLSPSARISLAYYRNEYETRAMTVDALVAVLLELLDTPHKYALLGHLRNSIRPEDLDKVWDPRVDLKSSIYHQPALCNNGDSGLGS
ncbi:hypothetical protein MTO96_029175 [Rhipicephalus appendiculatus]